MTVTPSRQLDYFYNQDWQLLEERCVDGVGAASNQYVWSPRYIDAPVVRFQDGNGDGDLLDAVDNTRYYTGDANYNPNDEHAEWLSSMLFPVHGTHQRPRTAGAKYCSLPKCKTW